PPRPPLFPYTTLFRSLGVGERGIRGPVAPEGGGRPGDADEPALDAADRALHHHVALTDNGTGDEEVDARADSRPVGARERHLLPDRKSTRLNSSHVAI